MQGIGVAIDGKLGNRQNRDTMSVVMEGDVDQFVGAMFFEGEDVGNIRFSRSAKGQQAQRDLARGDAFV